MNARDELDVVLQDVPVTDACGFCGSSSEARRLRDAGCRFCRKSSGWGRPIGHDPSKVLSEEETVEAWKRQLAQAEAHPGGVAGYCKEFGMNEKYLRSLGGRLENI